jgi:hypothetical protein
MGRVASIEEMINATKVLLESQKVIPRRRWEDSIKMDVK